MKYFITIAFACICSMNNGLKAQQEGVLWVVDFSKVKNGHRDEMRYYIENNWKVYRDRALEEGHICAYQLLETTPDSLGDFDYILMTGFRDTASFRAIETAFGPIIRQLAPDGPRLLNQIKPADFRKIQFSKGAKTLFAAQAKRTPEVHIPNDATNIARLKEINRDIWTPFSTAYATDDAAKYIGLHTADFIRATSGQSPDVKDLAAYSKEIKASFDSKKSQGRKTEIQFTFFERVANENTASERGIYRYADISKEGETQYYYGKFHVYHRKIKGKWKIAVDYDSDEDNTITAEDFRAGLAPDVFLK